MINNWKRKTSVLGMLITGLVIWGIFVTQGDGPLVAANPGPPPDAQVPVFAVQLQGGHNHRGSPKIADVRLDVPGLEIATGTAATVASQGSYSASVALVSSKGAILWERQSYTYGGSTYPVGTVMGSPAIADIDGDGQLDVVVGMGGHSNPRTRGGILALDGYDGSVKWYVATKSLFDSDGIPDGVYTSPSVADFDGDGHQEVVVAGFDHFLWLIDGPTGAVEIGFPINTWDTINSSTAVADLDGDGWLDFTFGGDFTNNGAEAYRTDDVSQLPPDGGVMRAMKYKDGQFYLPGWDECLSTVWPCVPDTNNFDLLIPIGQWVEQVIFSSPAIGDIDQDGQMEIVVGSGYYWNPENIGHWVKIWRANGTLLKTIPTTGITFASPALADLNGDGYLDIVIGDMQMGNNSQDIYSGIMTGPSRLYAWSGKPADNFAPLWTPQVIGMWSDAAPNVGLFGSPVVADVDPIQAGPEILVGFYQEIVVFNGRTGEQLTYVKNGPDKPTLATFGFHQNSPAVADIDQDGQLEIVATADFAFPIYSPRTWRQHVVVWHWPGGGQGAANASRPWPMFRRDGPNHAYYSASTLNVSPDTFVFLYQVGSGDPNPTSSLTISNLYNTDSMDYTITYPSFITLGGATSGTLGPSASIEVPFTVLARVQNEGKTKANIIVTGTSSGEPLQNSPYTIPVTLFVGDLQLTHLPLILK